MLPAGSIDDRTTLDNAGSCNIRVGYVSICFSLRKRCRDGHGMIEVIEVYGSLVHLPVVLSAAPNRPLDVIVDPLPQSLRLCQFIPTSKTFSSNCGLTLSSLFKDAYPAKHIAVASPSFHGVQTSVDVLCPHPIKATSSRERRRMAGNTEV